ncbi:MAG TPA: integrase core domain-containing protein [Thermoanaerobaculia bacterium]|nr:integrase core domain-containing protein [Thermoanaerobaculia bacterium]
MSRYLIACDAYLSNESLHTQRAFERIFREYGLPRAILSDNGSPFGSPGLARLSRLSLWWIRLGIRIERIVPGHPEQNGAHERMHRTLKAETARPPERTLDRQQKRFDEFRHTYNHERPHEALGAEAASNDLSPVLTAISGVASAGRVRRPSRDPQDRAQRHDVLEEQPHLHEQDALG